MPAYADSPPPADKRARGTLVAGTATAAVLTAVVSLVGMQAASNYADLATPDDKLPGLRRTANITAVGAGVTGAATVGLGVALAVRW